MIKIQNSKRGSIFFTQRFSYMGDPLCRKHEFHECTKTLKHEKKLISWIFLVWLFRSLIIVIWDLFAIWCWKFGIFLPAVLC